MGTYTLMHELMASSTEPLAPEKRNYHLARIRQGLYNIARAPQPSYDDWKVCSTAVNMMETLIEMGVVQDPDGLHADAIKSMAEAGTRHAEKGVAIRLSGFGIQAMQALVRDYGEVIEQIPARTMIRAFRLTEQKVERMFGKKTKRRGVKL